MVILDYVLPSLLLLVSIISLGVVVYALAKAHSLILSVYQSINDFFEPAGKDQLSPWGEVVNAFTANVGNEVGHGVQRALSQSMGGTMKGATAELEQRAIADNPNLAVMGMLPKSIQRNPLAMIAFQQIMNKGGLSGLGGGAKSGGDNHSPGNQGVFNI